MVRWRAKAALIAHEIVRDDGAVGLPRAILGIATLLVAAAALGAVAVVVMGLAMSKSGRRGPRPMAEASRRYVEPPEPPTSPPPSGPR